MFRFPVLSIYYIFSFRLLRSTLTQGGRLFLRPTTLSAISRAVDGVERRLFDPSHPTSPCASIGYSISALRCAPAALGPSPRCEIRANLGLVSGRCRHRALYRIIPLPIISTPGACGDEVRGVRTSAVVGGQRPGWRRRRADMGSSADKAAAPR